LRHRVTQIWCDPATTRAHINETGREIPVTAIRFPGLGIPTFLIRPSGGRETVLPNAQISFDVTSCVAGLGLLIRYSAVLAPCTQAAP